jgi:hypothetical protein
MQAIRDLRLNREWELVLSCREIRTFVHGFKVDGACDGDTEALVNLQVEAFTPDRQANGESSGPSSFRLSSQVSWSDPYAAGFRTSANNQTLSLRILFRCQRLECQSQSETDGL